MLLEGYLSVITYPKKSTHHGYRLEWLDYSCILASID